ncbi:MAG: aminotransferase class V-fold PLP-dependent enzyme, partial [Mycobacteriales bacterium]
MSVQAWVSDRLPTERVHLDVAAAGRVSQAVLDAEVAHLRAEACGAYVAEAQSAAAVDQGRAALGHLVGLGGEDVLLTESATLAFTTVLEAWPLPRGARIGVLPSEYGSNARALRVRAAERGWELVTLATDDLGRVTEVPGGLDLVTLTHVASQRGVVQPVGDVLTSGVPLLLDVAQSMGQTDVPPGAAAYVGTSRKWLCGPRGVGFAVVDRAWHERLTLPPTLRSVEVEGMRRFDSSEAHVAGRVGLALAARTWSPALLPVLQA